MLVKLLYSLFSQLSSYDVVNCNLKEKADWLVERNPGGKVPVLETKDGVVIYESLVVAEYLDEIFPSTRPLLPKDPYKRAQDRMHIGNFSAVGEHKSTIF